MNILGAETDLIRTSVGGHLAPRDVIRVFGADARKFLQGQLTQDVVDLDPGEFRWSLILSPKGRVDALVRVWGGNSDAEMLLDVEGGSGKAVVDRLNLFRMRVKAEVELLRWQILVLIGPDAESAAAETTAQLRTAPDRTDTSSLGLSVVELLGPSIAVPDDLLMVSQELIDSIRISGSWPSTRNEIELVDPAPFANELGEVVVDLTTNFDKGCYTGQEFIARVHARKVAPPRTLRRVELPGLDSPPDHGTTMSVGDSEAFVTSAGRSLDTDEVVVLAYVSRGTSA